MSASSAGAGAGRSGSLTNHQIVHIFSVYRQSLDSTKYSWYSRHVSWRADAARSSPQHKTQQHVVSSLDSNTDNQQVEYR